MPTTKKREKKKHKRTIPDFTAALWTVPMSCAWSGLKHKYVLNLIRTGVLEAVAMGPEREDTLPDGTVRRRACAKYLVVAKSFRAFVESLGSRGKLTIAS
jgi:hypothetical protein